MTREKVIEGLETALAVSNVVVGTDYVVVKIGEVKKVLELLKEQEPVKPVETWNTYLCGNCNRNVYHEERQGCLVLYEERYTYCPNCGRMVKWDDSDRNGNG